MKEASGYFGPETDVLNEFVNIFTNIYAEFDWR